MQSQGCCCGGFMTTNVCGGGGGTVTRVRVEQIDSRPLSTSSRHVASIIVRRQEHFEASWSCGGPSGQAGGHVTRLLPLAATKKRGRPGALMTRTLLLHRAADNTQIKHPASFINVKALGTCSPKTPQLPSATKFSHAVTRQTCQKPNTGAPNIGLFGNSKIDKFNKFSSLGGLLAMWIRLS